MKEDSKVTDDSDYPNPSKPWCRICRKHCKYIIKVISSESGTGVTTRNHFYCTECDKEMYIPNGINNIGRLLAVTFIGMTVFCFLVGLIIGEPWDAESLTIFGITLSIALIACFGLHVHYGNFYKEWKSWALSKGYSNKEINN